MNPFGLGIRAYSAYNVARYLEPRVIGAEHVPRRGPALIAARHYHHLFDGAMLVDRLPRQPHLLVALDWAGSRTQRTIMETLCNLCEWPIVLRAENLGTAAASSFARHEARGYLRKAAARARALLARGEVVAIFPEGYPTVDPAGSRKLEDDDFLPFRSGGLRLALAAARATGRHVPIVPAGFAYRSLGSERFAVTMRIGPPLDPQAMDRSTLARELERRVRALSVA